MTKKSALFVLVLVSLIGLATGCKGNSRGTEKNSAHPSSSTLNRSESASVLVGHWRKTTIVFEGPEDEHLVLEADGTATTWIVTASSQSSKTVGKWTVEEKNLTLLLEGNVVSRPFTIYKGDLVFPNIQNKRGFWEKIAE